MEDATPAATSAAATELPPGYPEELDRSVVGSDGRSVRVRPIRPDDGPALVDLHGRLSPRSIHMRFFSAHPRLSAAEVERFTHVDYQRRLALVVEDGGRLAGVGRYDRLPDTDDAEAAFVVADDHQHRGLGTILLETLAEAAWARGITAFVAQTLAENGEMLQVFTDSGFPVHTSREHEVIEVRFSIEPDARYRSAVAGRHGGPPAPAPDGGAPAPAPDGGAPAPAPDGGPLPC
jgi:GNAT superfamily N-acetyltransferase